jgi:hypothetical protein
MKGFLFNTAANKGYNSLIISLVEGFYVNSLSACTADTAVGLISSDG